MDIFLSLYLLADAKVRQIIFLHNTFFFFYMPSFNKHTAKNYYYLNYGAKFSQNEFFGR